MDSCCICGVSGRLFEVSMSHFRGDVCSDCLAADRHRKRDEEIGENKKKKLKKFMNANQWTLAYEFRTVGMSAVYPTEYKKVHTLSIRSIVDGKVVKNALWSDKDLDKPPSPELIAEMAKPLLEWLEEKYKE